MRSIFVPAGRRQREENARLYLEYRRRRGDPPRDAFQPDASLLGPKADWLACVCRYSRAPWLGALTRLDTPAFAAGLMSISFYMEMDGLLDDLFGDEPEARDRLRAQLHGVMVDELSRAGERRNRLGRAGVRAARAMAGPLIRGCFAAIPEAARLFNVDTLAARARGFHYGRLPPDFIAKSWVPTYCRN